MKKLLTATLMILIIAHSRVDVCTGRSGPQITVEAHNDDVNVISWNKSVSYLLASGCDDGSFKVRSEPCAIDV